MLQNLEHFFNMAITLISLVSTAAWIQIALWRPLDQQYKYVAYYTKSNALTNFLYLLQA